MNLSKICSDVEQTIRAWQDDESNHRELSVDEGNIQTFIREVNETVINSIRKEREAEEAEKAKEACVQEVCIDYFTEYNRLREENHHLKEDNKSLTEAVVNLALKLK